MLRALFERGRLILEGYKFALGVPYRAPVPHAVRMYRGRVHRFGNDPTRYLEVAHDPFPDTAKGIARLFGILFRAGGLRPHIATSTLAAWSQDLYRAAPLSWRRTFAEASEGIRDLTIDWYLITPEATAVASYTVGAVIDELLGFETPKTKPEPPPLAGLRGNPLVLDVTFKHSGGGYYHWVGDRLPEEVRDAKVVSKKDLRALQLFGGQELGDRLRSGQGVAVAGLQLLRFSREEGRYVFPLAQGQAERLTK